MAYDIRVHHAGPVSSALFGAIKRLVCGRHQGAPVTVFARPLRSHADTNGHDAGLARWMWNPQVFNACPNTLSDDQRAVLIGICQDQCELFATIPSRDVRRSPRKQSLVPLDASTRRRSDARRGRYSS
jgi:hypothetical protein